MKYHSEEYQERHSTFRHVLAAATESNYDVLIVCPNDINSLDEYLSPFFREKMLRKLKKERKLSYNDVNYFIETPKSDKSDFKKGNIFLPWASPQTWRKYLNDDRKVNTYFIPWMGPGAAAGGEDELGIYLKENRDSVEI